MRHAWMAIGLVVIGACGGEERRRAGPSAVVDPYGGGEEQTSPAGGIPDEEAPTEDRIDLGVSIDEYPGVLVERAHTAACDSSPMRPARPNLDTVLLALAGSQAGLQTCYENARETQDPDNEGVTVSVRATFGENGCLERAVLAPHDDALTVAFTMCIAEVAKDWSIPTFAERSQHEFSLDLAPPE